MAGGGFIAKMTGGGRIWRGALKSQAKRLNVAQNAEE
jgi:hypothetical protein